MAEMTSVDNYRHLSSYSRCIERIAASWTRFSARRTERLQQGLFGAPVEKVAENICEDLFTQVLDWNLADVNLQVGRADIILSELGIKRLVLEVKRPGSLAWHRTAVEAALAQARGYAAEQKVGAVAVSDGQMLYAADVGTGGMRDRLFVALDSGEPPLDLWWLSVHGIYRQAPAPSATLPSTPVGNVGSPEVGMTSDELLHHKYQLPARCFAFVGAANNPSTWKLPYVCANGSPDLKRLPKALQSILSNFRGVKVSIPREAIPDVLVRLGKAAAVAQKMPCQCVLAADAYAEAHEALDQLGRLSDVGCC